MVECGCGQHYEENTLLARPVGLVSTRTGAEEQYPSRRSVEDKEERKKQTANSVSNLRVLILD